MKFMGFLLAKPTKYAEVFLLQLVLRIYIYILMVGATSGVVVALNEAETEA